MPDPKREQQNEMQPDENIRRRDQAEGGEDLGDVEEMVDTTPGQAEGERKLIDEKLRDEE
ncbi:MAG: hypothetical protein ACOCXZ_03095 [Chloroflexota bacterium]